MSILNTAQGRKIVERVTLKKVKLNIGHDLAGMYADFYLDGGKMGYFSDDGLGGETDVNYVSVTAKEKFENFLIENNVAQLMFDNGWKFMETPSLICLHSQTENIINEAVNLVELKKHEKSLEKKLEEFYLSNIVAGKIGGKPRGKGYKITFKEIIAKYPLKGKESIQALYDEMKAGLKEGETILNKNLEELGIKL